MSLRSTTILAVVAVVLGAFVYFYEIEGEVARQAALDEEKKVHAGLEAEAIEAVELRTLDGISARFEREGGRWRVVRPVEDRADALALDAIASALADLPRAGSVDGAGDLAGFELGVRAQTVRFEVAGETLGLRIGRHTPVGGHRYVARLADDEVAYVESHRVNAFKRNLVDLRDRRLFAFESGEVTAFRVGWSEAGEPIEIALAKDATGSWQIEEPLQAKADDETVRDLLSNLVYLRASGFVDAPDPAVEAALGETAISFRWRVEGGEGESSARLAGVVGEGDRLIQTTAGRLYTVPAERLDDFPREIEAYRFKRLADLEVSAARRLELEFAEGGLGDDPKLRIVAELGETAWSSEGRRLDSESVSRLVRELAGLEADELVADEMGPDELASLGLLPPRARLRVEGGIDRGGPVKALADLRFGRLDPDRGLFVQRSDSPTVFLVAPAVAERLPYSAEHYAEAFEFAAGEAEPEAGDHAPGLGAIDPLEGVDLP